MKDPCFHGGAFWNALGVRFDRQDLKDEVINADVLDAWFPPAPGVQDALLDWEWIARTSPPTHAEGLKSSIAGTRAIPERCVLPGPGSSSLIYLVLSRWLSPASRVLLIEPSYGEYAHLCRHVVGSRVDRYVLREEDGFKLDTKLWVETLISGRYDLAVLVNPNNPAGGVISAAELIKALHQIPESTRLWIDEAYVDYAGREFSLESFAAHSPNLAVVKSLSKGYALSGLRAAYLVANEAEIESLARWTPPWALSLPAQIAAIRANRKSRLLLY